ncbi:MAG: penicillin-binding transpeptidase domain-containing protein [Clostridia bacterium]|nr:penicillin-binding transpeptidase domain-containing protein [Clostridia bacterium]
MKQPKRSNDRTQYSFTSRYWVFIGIVFAIFGYLVSGLFQLQIVQGEDYIDTAENKTTTTITLRGSRGMITDSEAVILAHDEKVYNVTFYRDADQNSSREYAAFTDSIVRTIDIIEEGGNELAVKFVIQRNEDTGNWEFNFGSGVSEAVLQTRESQWRSNNYMSAAKYPLASDCLARLKSRFRIVNSEEEQEQLRAEAAAAGKSYTECHVLDEETMLKVMAVFSEMQMNLFNSQPIVIAQDVPYETVIKIETQSMTLPGMEIAMGTKRVYPRGSLAAQVIGYMGAIPSTEKWLELKPKGYKFSDTIGVDGIEASMEDWLTQNSDLRQGYREVERNSVGKITRELSYTEPEDGNNVKLTIKASYQQQAERALAANVSSTRSVQENKLMNQTWLEKNKADIENRNWEKYPLSLAERAAMMVIDMEGRVLAMANYPTFDLNAMVSGGEERAAILTDNRNVLMNYNIHARGTPGSIFKMVSSLGALMEGELYPNETISDGGRFLLVTSVVEQAPKCWISEGQRYKHQHQTIIQGLSNSCNYFFYTLGWRLGETRLYQYASEFGLTSKTGVDLPGELRSIVGCQTSLYDPDKAMDESSQDTAVPIIVFNSLKKHLRNQGASRNITYDDERLNRCVKRLMDMAVNTDQGAGGELWLREMRPILMEELNMTREMVYTQSIIGDTFNYLNDIKWGASQTVQVAIGQSITVLTPAAVSRYVAALGNGGKVYNLMLVDSITSPDGDIVSQRTPSMMNQFEGAETYLPYILEGMKGVVDESGTAGKYFRNFDYKDRVCAKTGTAEVTTIDLENNAWFVMLAPFSSEEINGVPTITEQPEIAVVVFIPSGFSGGEASVAARDFVKWYMDQKVLRTENSIFPAGNQLAP